MLAAASGTSGRRANPGMSGTPPSPGAPYGHALWGVLRRNLTGPAGGGLVLIAAMVLALLGANSPWAASFDHLWHIPISVTIAQLTVGYDLHHWINDGLMAVFFLLVGLEIKREVRYGELSALRKAALPAAAAIGGMMVPALIYVMLTHGTPAAAGWAIPMATDIAFAVGVLALLGSRAPAGLKVFLTALAILDDLGAVLVIGICFSQHISYPALGSAAGLLALGALFNILGVRSLVIYLMIGLALWYAVMQSGIHATISGVALAMVIPASAAPGEESQDQVPPSPALHLEHILHPWVIYGIMPLFALANAGINLGTIAAQGLQGDALPISLGIILGLVVGKPLGVFAFSYLAVLCRAARLPEGVRWSQVLGVACLAGIGFTMSLFITGLAFSAPERRLVGIGAVLIASMVSGILGAALLMRRGASAAPSP